LRASAIISIAFIALTAAGSANASGKHIRCNLSGTQDGHHISRQFDFFIDDTNSALVGESGPGMGLVDAFDIKLRSFSDTEIEAQISDAGTGGFTYFGRPTSNGSPGLSIDRIRGTAGLFATFSPRGSEALAGDCVQREAPKAKF
jgi:hypothetical protein